MARPLDGDLSRDDIDTLREKVASLYLLSSNRQGLTDVRTLTPNAQANALVEWALRAPVGEAAETSFRPALDRFKGCYRQAWRLYTAYVELVGNAPMLRQSRLGRSPAEQVVFREHVEWINRLQTTAVTFRFAIQVLDALTNFELIMGAEQSALPQVVPMQQCFFERDFLRTLGVPDEDQESEIKKQGGKRGQARYELVHYCLDYALRNRYCRIGDTVYEERRVEVEGRSYRTRAYKRIEWPDGNSREDKGSILEFVIKACSRQVNEDMNDRLVVHDLVRYVAEYVLHHQDDDRFPKLEPLRRILSFRNGIYDTQVGPCGQFFPYAQIHLCEALEPNKAAAAKFFDHTLDAEGCYASLEAGLEGWFNIPTPLFQSVLDYQNHGQVVDPERQRVATVTPDVGVDRPAKQAAMQILRHLKDYVEIAEAACSNAQYAESDDAARDELLAVCANGARFVSKAQTVMSDHGVTVAPPSEEVREPQPLPQDLGGPPAPPPPRRAAPGNSLPVDAQKMIYVLIGRLLHDLGTFDQWQVLLFIKGRAGTGKSLIAEICMNFFEPQHIGQVANNMEETFGISQVAEKFLWVCTEVKKNFKMDQSLFQQIVSGECVSAAQKNKEAWTGKWRVPGLMAGNEWAAYQDAQGSIARRLAIVNFLYPIHEKDSNPQLKNDILEQELGRLILKCNVAYRLAASAREGRDIWKVLPEYFKVQRRALQIDTDPLIAVLNDETVFERHAPSYISLKTLDTEYRQRWRQIRGTHFPENLSDDKLMSALHEIGSSKVTEVRVDPVYGQDPRLDTWILGLRSVRDADAASTGGGAGGAPPPPRGAV